MANFLHRMARILAMKNEIETEIASRSKQYSTLIPIPADAAANDTWEVPISRARTEGRIAMINIIPKAGIGQATNYMTLKAINKGSNGSGTTELGSIELDGSTGNTIGAWLSKNIVSSIPDVISPNLITLKKEVTGSGQAWPGGVVEVVYTGPA